MLHYHRDPHSVFSPPAIRLPSGILSAPRYCGGSGSSRQQWLVSRNAKAHPEGS